MLDTTHKKKIPEFVKQLQAKLRQIDSSWTQERIAKTIYKDNLSVTNPKDNYLKRFIQRAESTRYREQEVIEFISVFQSLLEPLQAVVFVAWTQVDADVVLKAIADLFNPADFDKACQLYQRRTNFDYIMFDEDEIQSSSHLLPFHCSGHDRVLVDINRLIGIEQTVTRIAGLLHAEKGYRFISIEGIGGIGKTSIAHAVVQQVRQQAQFEGVVWLSTQSAAISQTAFDLQMQLADIFSIAVEKVASVIENARFLIIIDNIETAQQAEELIKQLQNFQYSSTCFLVTSRFALDSLSYAFYSIKVSGLTRDAIAQLLTDLLRQSIQRDDVDALTRISGGHPLAVHMVARLARFSDLHSVMSQFHSITSSDSAGLAEWSPEFKKIFSIIWKKLDSFTQDLLIRLAIQMPRQGIPLSLAAVAADLPAHQATESINRLCDHFLLEKQPANRETLLKMHPLIRTCLTDIHSNTGLQIHQSLWQDSSQRLLDELHQIIDSPDRLVHAIPFVITHLEHLFRIPVCHAVAVDIVILLDVFPVNQGFRKEWRKYVNEAYRICQANNQSPDADLRRLQMIKALIDFRTGNLEEARINGQTVIELAVAQDDVPLLSHAMYLVSSIYLAQNRFEEARSLIKENQKFINTREVSPDIVYLKLSWIQVYHRSGQTEKISTIIQSVDSQAFSTLTLSHQAIWYHHVGLFYWRRDDYHRALDNLLMAKNLFARVLDKREIGLISDIGLILWKMGKFDEAIDQFNETLQRLESDADYRTKLNVLSYKAFVCFFKGKLALAMRLNNQALQMAEAGAFQYEVNRITGNRGIIKLYLGDYEGAEKDLTFDLESHTTRNEGYVDALLSLSRLRNISDDPETARELAEEAHTIAIENQYRSAEIAALRSLAECSDNSSARQYLLDALDKLQNDQSFHKAACLLSLSEFADEEEERERLQLQGQQLLEDMGATYWLQKRMGSYLIPFIG